MGEAGAVAIGVALEELRRLAPSAIGKVRTWLVGKNLLVLGPARSGKTSFTDYFVYGVLYPEGQRASSLEIDKHPSFEIEVGRQQALRLTVKKTMDVPGQLGPIEHARLALTMRPHAIIVMLDGSAFSKGSENPQQWLQTFCGFLDDGLKKDRRYHRKLSLMMILLNKADKIPSDNLPTLISTVRSILSSSLVFSFGQSAQRIPVLPTISVKHSDATVALENVISEIARGLR